MTKMLLDIGCTVMMVALGVWFASEGHSWRALFFGFLAGANLICDLDRYVIEPVRSRRARA